MRNYKHKTKTFKPEHFWLFAKMIGEFKADYLNIGSESADLIERIIDAFRSDSPKFKEEFFRAKMQEFFEEKRNEMKASLKI